MLFDLFFWVSSSLKTPFFSVIFLHSETQSAPLSFWLYSFSRSFCSDPPPPFHRGLPAVLNILSDFPAFLFFSFTHKYLFSFYHFSLQNFWILLSFFPPPPVRESCLTLLFLPALLSGVVQTFGARQEPPGVARLSAPFIPIRSDAGTASFVSSQQQLQEGQLAAVSLVHWLTLKLTPRVQTSAVFLASYLFIFSPVVLDSFIWTTGGNKTWLNVSERRQARLISGSQGLAADGC